MAIQWPLVLFTLIAGAGAGMLTCAGLGEFLGASKKTRFVAAIIALVLFVVGGIASILHLGQPASVMAAAANLGSFSPISLELIFLGLSALVALIYIFVVNREGGASKIVGIIGVVVGIIFMYVSGHGYEVITARPAWANPALSLGYLFTSLTLGGFCFLALQAIFKDEADSFKKAALIVAVVAALATIALAVYGFSAPLGESAVLFWICAVVVGGVLSVVAGVVAFMKENSAMAYLGVLTALVGGLAFRIIMWMIASPTVPNLFDIASQNRGLFPF
jgi:anaerobic dimethyl sulfoxide reductase subunit C (anchor subunit)